MIAEKIQRPHQHDADVAVEIRTPVVRVLGRDPVATRRATSRIQRREHEPAHKGHLAEAFLDVGGARGIEAGAGRLRSLRREA